MTLNRRAKKALLAILLGTLTTATGLLAVAANAGTPKTAEFKTYLESQSPIPEYFFENNASIPFDRSSQLQVADTATASYWYISRSDGFACVVARTKALEQISAGCAPNEFAADHGLSLQMTQLDANAIKVAAFLLPEGYTSTETKSTAQYTTPNFIEIDGISDPQAYAANHIVVGSSGEIELRILDLEQNQ